MAWQLSAPLHLKTPRRREVRRGLCACRKPLSNSQDASTNLTVPAWFQLCNDGEHVTPLPLRTYQSAPAFLISSSSVERGGSRRGQEHVAPRQRDHQQSHTRCTASRRPRLHASPLGASPAPPWRRSRSSGSTNRIRLLHREGACLHYRRIHSRRARGGRNGWLRRL